MSNMKLGVVGGMGPMATSMFFERIIKKTMATKDQEHMDMVILNHATMPDRTEAIITGNDALFLSHIEHDFKMLEMMDVAYIAIPCNTSHFFMEEMIKLTHIPIINMVEETAKEIKVRYGVGKKVGILATNGTIQTGTYERACLNHGLLFEKPSPADQETVMKIIYDIKSDLPIEKEQLEQIIMKMVTVNQCDCVILACTELSLIKLKKDVARFCVDAMDVLVERAIVYSGKQLKP
ncbi:MAG TPA: aspartate racemase [Clostridiales bacterium UBA8960]|nr:aspartate racemase [Clostridiales bacterium UBA8960]